MSEELPGHLTGNFHVRALRSAFQDARHWLPRTSDRMELRRHALKLRFWPEKHPVDAAGVLQDLDWCWIAALRGQHVGELRINDTIGGHKNLRVIFFDPQVREPLPILWLISVFQKKRNDFTSAQISGFELRRDLVLARFYGKL